MIPKTRNFSNIYLETINDIQTISNLNINDYTDYNTLDINVVIKEHLNEEKTLITQLYRDFCVTFYPDIY